CTLHPLSPAPRPRRPPHRRPRHPEPPLPRAGDRRDHPLPPHPRVRRAGPGPRPEERHDRRVGRQGARPRAREERLRRIRGRLMDTLTDIRDHYLTDFGRVGKALPGVADLRKKAIERFAALGFPTGREEAWRFTDVTPIAEVPFKPAVGTANPNQFAGLAKGALKALQITFVDGRFAPSFSSLDLPEGVGVTSVGEILKTAPDILAPLLQVPNDAFAALNTAFF